MLPIQVQKQYRHSLGTKWKKRGRWLDEMLSVFIQQRKLKEETHRGPEQETGIFPARHCRAVGRKVLLGRRNQRLHNPIHKLHAKLKEFFALRRSCQRQQQQDAIWSSELRLMLWGEDSHLVEDSGGKMHVCERKRASVPSWRRQGSVAWPPPSPSVHPTKNNPRDAFHIAHPSTHFHPSHSVCEHPPSLFTTIWILPLTLNASVGVITLKLLLQLTVFKKNKHAWYSGVDYFWCRKCYQ